MSNTNLADFISSNMDPILKEWATFAESLLSVHHADPEEARDHARGMLIAIAADIDSKQTLHEQEEKSKGHATPPAQETQASLHGTARMASGFNVNDDVSEFRALRATVLRLWNESKPTTTSDTVDELIRFNEAIDQALAESIEGYTTEKDRYTHLLDRLLSTSPDLNYVLGLDGHVIYANKALCDLYKLAPSEIIGKDFSDFIPAIAAEFKQQLENVIKTRTIYRSEMPCACSTDKSVRYEYLLVPVINAQDQVEAFAGTARNMTHRNQLESELKREKIISDTIIESYPGAFFMIDQQFKLVRWNKNLKQQTGLSDDQLLNTSILPTIHADDRELASANLLTAFATGYARMEIRVITHDLGIRYFLKSVRRLYIDGVPYVAGFCLDVTDRKHSADALEREKLFSDALINGIPGAFYVINLEGGFSRWNGYLNRLTGLSDSALRMFPLLLILHEEDRILAAKTMKEAFENGYAQAELRVLTHDRGIRLFLMTARRFQVGTDTYLVGVGTDTTEWLAKLKSLEHEAWIDPLTQVANRGHFMEQAKQEFARCRRYGHPVSIWMLDIDHFKAVNDTYGHHAGDLVLQSMALTSQQALRDWDLLGRVGGEEFAVLLPETEADQAMLVAERLRQSVAMARTLLEDGQSVGLTVSIGIATAKNGDCDFETLLGRADHALYEAKRSGRDKVCLAENLLSE